MEVLSYLVIGLVVGGIARLFLSVKSPVGCLGTIFVGVAGAFLGTKVWEELFGKQRGLAWIGSILMAMLILAILAKLAGTDRRF